MGFVDREQFRRLFFKLNVEFKPSQIDAVFDCLNSSELYDDLQPSWIPVSEQLPGNDDVVMVTVNDFGNMFVSIDSYMGGEWFSFPKCVTAWMHLPKPYEVKEE